MTSSRNLFRTLWLGMALLGLAIGAAFPFVMLRTGFMAPSEVRPPFIVAALCAGLVAGGINFALAASIVRPRLRILAARMEAVREALRQAAFTGNRAQWDPERSVVPEHGDDELGVVARNYNALLRGLHEAHQVEERIRGFTQALSSELDLAELGVRGLDLLVRNAGAQGGAILLERHGDWKVLASQGLRGAEHIARGAAFADACRKGQGRRMALAPDVAVDAVLSEFRPQDVLLEPIRHNGIVLGWLILASSAELAEEALRLIPVLLQGLGLALNNALLYDDLQRVAALDPLTGVYNRRFGLRRLDEELARAARAQAPLALIVLDLDHFKQVNDSFGHLAGDRVLVHVAQFCLGVLRDGDLLMRYGGEEFVAILPGASLADAAAVAERIRFGVGAAPLETDAGMIAITVSIGVAACPGDAAVDPEALLDAADKRLYMAKSAGRNRVVASAHGQGVGSGQRV